MCEQPQWSIFISFCQNRYRADLNWMKGTGWIATGSLNVKQAQKAGELISEVRFHDSRSNTCPIMHVKCRYKIKIIPLKGGEKKKALKTRHCSHN